MKHDETIRIRLPSSLKEDIEETAARTGETESEVARRLLRLGMEDVAQLGDEAVLVVASGTDN